MEDLSRPLLLSIVNLFLEVCPLFVVILDKQNVIYMNAQSRRLVNQSDDIHHVLPDDLSGHPKNVIKTIDLPGQSTLIIQWSQYYLLPKKGQTLILLAGEDISEREAHRKRAALLNDIIAKVPGFVFWKDTDLKLMGGNENFTRQVGYQQPQDIVGLTDHDLPWSPAQTEKFIQDDRHILQTGIPILNIEEKQRQLDGQDLTLLTSKVPLYADGQMAGVLGIYVDITPFKKVERALLLEKEKAEAANRIKTDFILNMQHDIRTPISGIYGMIEVLAEGENRKDIQTKLVMVAQAVSELLDYCNDIVDFARVDYGIRPVLSQPFDLKALLHALMRMQAPAAKIKKIQLTLTVGKNVPAVVLSDLYRLKRILINLISNAIKFTCKGCVKVSAHVEKKSNTQTQNEKILCLTIEDSGIGIPTEKIGFIYEKFARITPSNKGLYKGSGLGLRIVKQFIEEMGGNIYVNSEINQGTKFKLLLPVAIPLSNDIIKR